MSRFYPLWVFTALILGLGWAIRGHFGHEWGAAWAGALGALALVVSSKRPDWAANAPTLTLLGAVGWAVGGMMSYGLVIGYCRGTDFANVWYGYGMLAVIGGLYGAMGGGFVGLGLETTEEKRPQWASLITEMVAGAYLVWGLIIYQLEWLMTPPRSELWAACLGATAAMFWHFHRNGFPRAAQVAAYAALGAGFGFSFGNFIQTLGTVSGLNYNWWNVMEFTLGFFGGLGMAYGVSRTSWPQNHPVSSAGNWVALISTSIIIPLVNFFAGFSDKKLQGIADSIGLSNSAPFIFQQKLYAVGIILLGGISMVFIWRRITQQPSLKNRGLLAGLLGLLALYYILFSYILKGLFYQPFQLHNSLIAYIPLLLFAFLTMRVSQSKDSSIPSMGIARFLDRQFVRFVFLFLLVILIIAYISIHTHSGIPGAQQRF